MIGSQAHEPLAWAFARAVVDHFGIACHADAEGMTVASCNVVRRAIAGVPVPTSCGVLLGHAQSTLGRVVAEVVKEEGRRGTT